MRVALIGDVHTNVGAWDAVVQDLSHLNTAVEHIWALGDWLGYGEQNPLRLWCRLGRADHPALAALRDAPEAHGVRGNHDVAVMDGFLAGFLFNERARNVISRQREALALSYQWHEEFAPWLRMQPLMLSPMSGVYLAHGAFSIDNPHLMTDLYTPRDLPHGGSLQRLHHWLECGQTLPDGTARAIGGWDVPLLLATGHTHKQGVWQCPGGRTHPFERFDHWPLLEAARISSKEIQHSIESLQALDRLVHVEFSADRPVWINPGSVGDPRDPRTPRPAQGWQWARYVILDWAGPGSRDADVHLRWVPYSMTGEEDSLP